MSSANSTTTPSSDSSSSSPTATSTMSSSESSSASTNTPTSSVAETSSAPVSSTSIDTSAIASSVSSVISSELNTPTSTTAVATSTTAQSTSVAPVTTSTTIAPSTIPGTTIIATSVVEVSGSGTNSASRVTVVVTESNPATTVAGTTAPVTSQSSTTTSGSPSLNTGGSGSGGSGGLSTAGVTAVAVVVPVVVVALLVLAGIFLYRKRKQKKAAEEARRNEVEDYGFNPNNDPTLPTVASESGQEMSEDHSSGYRGWGAAIGSNRKMSTTLSGGHTQGQLSDVGSSAYHGQASPTHGSDGHSGDPLVNQRRETMNSDDIGALGGAPVAGAGINHGMKRGPSNASSTYSAGAPPSETSDGIPPNGLSQSYEAYNPNTGFGYSQHGPYGDGTYGGATDAGMPIVRDVSARRNTRIQQPGNYQQGNSGIAQNF